MMSPLEREGVRGARSSAATREGAVAVAKEDQDIRYAQNGWQI
jgi:hypothetical protein